MGKIPNREEAWELLCEFNKDEFHLKHARIMEGVMKYFARELGHGEEDFWGVVGLLHDLDFGMYPEEHCIKTQEIMRERGIDERLIHAVASHGYGICVDVEPEHEMEKILYATDELTRLNRSMCDYASIKEHYGSGSKLTKKEFKTPKFAAGCSREVISNGASMLGWELDELFDRTIQAVREVEQTTGLV